VLLGVNLGRVGFMSGMRPEDLDSGVQKVLDGALHVQEYRMLEVRMEGDGEVRTAVNDAVLLKETAAPDHLGRRGRKRGGPRLLPV
jgi:NAD+ kinase